LSIELFTATDFQSSTWVKLRKLMEERLQLHREMNDEPIHESDTSLLRGRIAELRFLLALPEYVLRAREAQVTIEPGDISSMY
jgi:hypothetical protein